MKVLITGGSGLLGLNWAIHGLSRHEVAVATHGIEVRLDGAHSFQALEYTLDILKMERWGFTPDVVIHTAGYTNVDQCERNPEIALKINRDLAGIVATYSNLVGAKMVHISTDHLFDGGNPFVSEAATPNPVNAYGRTKVMAEKIVLKSCRNSLIIRTNFFGWGHRYRDSITDWILTALRSENPINLFSDVFFTPIYVDDLIDSVESLIDIDATGIYNVVSGERLSKYEFANAVADKFELSKKYIVKSSSTKVDFHTKRPLDMSLCNEKITKVLGRNMPSAIHGLSRMKGSEARREILDAALID